MLPRFISQPGLTKTTRKSARDRERRVMVLGETCIVRASWTLAGDPTGVKLHGAVGPLIVFHHLEQSVAGVPDSEDAQVAEARARLLAGLEGEREVVPRAVEPAAALVPVREVGARVGTRPLERVRRSVVRAKDADVF